jgi:two-component system NtrC family sensor kinase
MDLTSRVGAVIFNQMTDAVLTLDARKCITTINPAAEKLYGFRADDVLGQPVGSVLEQLELDGSKAGESWLDVLETAHYRQGRLIHRPIVGAFKHRNIAVDLSVTALHDESRRPIGLLGLIREVQPSTGVDSDADALAAVAVATSRSRSRQEVADSALERLCEVTGADFAIVGTRSPDGNRVVESSRGLADDLIHYFESTVLPALTDALDAPNAVVPIETVADWLAGTEVLAAIQRSGLASGFLVGLRVRDDPVGFLGLGSRRPTWVRPRDEVVLQMATQVADALENARLMERLEDGLEQERLLTGQLETLIGLTLIPTDTSEEAMAQILLERVVSALAADAGLVATERGGHLEVVASLNMADREDDTAEKRRAADYQFWQRLLDNPRGGAFYQRADEIPESAPSLRSQAIEGTSSRAVFPILAGDQLFGAFLCYFRDRSEHNPVDERNVEAVGRVLSIAFANVRMHAGLAEATERERNLTAELQTLQELTLLGASTDDVTRLATQTIDAVVAATGATGGRYVLVDPSTGNADPIASSGDLIGGDLSISRVDQGAGVWLSEESGDCGPSPCAEALLPLHVDTRLEGVLQLQWKVRPNRDQYDVRFLDPISRICSISLANYRLRSELLHRAAAQRALGHRLDALDELTRIGEEASSFEELANRTANLVREALGASGVCYLLREPGHHFETHAVAGETGAFRLWLKGVPAKDAPGSNLLMAGGGSVLGDFLPGQVNERVLPLAQATGFESFGAIPIRTGEELAGSLLCFFEQPAAALPLDESALDSVSRIAGIALANFRLRERLVSSEERYRTLFEETPDALLVSALDGTVLDANEAAVRLYRVNRGEVLGRYLGQLIAADEREMARRRQIVWAQGGGAFRDRGRRPDGSEFPVQVEIRVVELGGQRRFLHLVRDLSDQESLQRELLQAQKMEAIGQLVSGVAHELNNPLAAIIAFSQLLRSDERLPDDMKHDAGLLVQEADRTRRIVQNLLDFARSRPPERRPTSISVLVHSVLELQSYALNTNQIEVKVEIPDSLPEVDLDRAQLQQVLLNLTINAIQAMRGRDRTARAHLTVKSAMVKIKPSSVGARADRQADDQPRVRISVIDDGPGVPEPIRARLFDPFFTTKQPGEGTGLGLSVSFGIVAAHGGQLWYEPGPRGVGSMFIIELPISAQGLDQTPAGGQAADARSKVPARNHARGSGAGTTIRRSTPHAAAIAGAPQSAELAPTTLPTASAAPEDRVRAVPATATAEAPATVRPRVLALDDEPSIRAFLRKALAAAGIDCEPVQDGQSALEILRQTTFDVMLIDHRMAGMSGTEFYEAAVEARPELAERAIFMSGDVLNPDLRGFATERGLRLLAKPFDIDAVVRVVKEVLAALGPTASAGHLEA